MPLQKVNRITTKGWPCALTALQCHLPSVPALVDGQCHLAGKLLFTVANRWVKLGRKAHRKSKKLQFKELSKIYMVENASLGLRSESKVKAKGSQPTPQE